MSIVGMVRHHLARWWNPFAAIDAASGGSVYKAANENEIRLSIVAFETEPRVAGTASYRIEAIGQGPLLSPGGHIILRWFEGDGEPTTAKSFGVDQPAAVLPALAMGERRILSGQVPVPINSVVDVAIELIVTDTNGRQWEKIGAPLRLKRRIGGNHPADSPRQFDYIDVYSKADLGKDYWSIVGPGSRSEYEALGRSKLAQLVSLGLGPQSRILDVGCGTGQLTEQLVPFLSPDGCYFGTDVVPKAVDFCRSRFKLPNFHFEVNAQSRLPIAGQEFDFVYLGSVFTHMYPDDIDGMTRELRRVTAITGCVIVDAFVSPSVQGHAGNQAMVQLNEGWLQSNFEAHGFTYRELHSKNWNETCRRVDYLLTPKA